VKRKRKKLQRHHNKAKSLGGSKLPNNIFFLTPEHHKCYHKLFRLRTFKEASAVLKRLSQRGQPEIL